MKEFNINFIEAGKLPWRKAGHNSLNSILCLHMKALNCKD